MLLIDMHEQPDGAIDLFGVDAAGGSILLRAGDRHVRLDHTIPVARKPLFFHPDGFRNFFYVQLAAPPPPPPTVGGAAGAATAVLSAAALAAAAEVWRH